eukprot:365907-Chlamydomonas_euryale.AAC.12
MLEERFCMATAAAARTATVAAVSHAYVVWTDIGSAAAAATASPPLSPSMTQGYMVQPVPTLLPSAVRTLSRCGTVRVGVHWMCGSQRPNL